MHSYIADQFWLTGDTDDSRQVLSLGKVDDMFSFVYVNAVPCVLFVAFPALFFGPFFQSATSCRHSKTCDGELRSTGARQSHDQARTVRS